MFKEKKIFFVGSDPGSININWGLYNLILENYDYELSFFTDTYEFVSKDRMDSIEKITIENIKTKIEHEKPKIIFLGTSIRSSIEKNILKFAKENSVFTVTLIDHWTELKNRFLFLDEYIYPDLIFVINEDAYTLAQKAGIQESRLQIFGNPYWNLLSNYTPVEKKSALINNTNKILTFLSDSLSESVGIEKSIKRFGYTEKMVLEKLFADKEFIRLIEQYNLNVIIKLHPMEKNDKFNWISKKYKNVQIISNCSLHDLLYYSDVVVGMFTAALLEAKVMEREVFRFEPGGENKNDYLPGSKIERLFNVQELINKLKNSLNQKIKANQDINLLKKEQQINILNKLFINIMI